MGHDFVSFSSGASASPLFREDLYFRLKVIEVYVPPLADRPDDLLPLAEHFLARHAAKESKGPLKLEDDAQIALASYEWPGNVRELQNRLQRAVLVAASDTITAGDLGLPAGAVRSDGAVRSERIAPGAVDGERAGIQKRWSGRAASSPRPPPRWACPGRPSTGGWSDWGS